MGVLAKQRRPASAVKVAQQAPQRNSRRPWFEGARERPPARHMIGVPCVISAKNVAFCPNNKKSSDIDAARRRRHGHSCFTFQFASLQKLLRKNKLDKLSWTDHIITPLGHQGQKLSEKNDDFHGIGHMKAVWAAKVEGAP